MKNIFSVILLMCVGQSMLHAQGMPDRMKISPDGHRVVTGAGRNNHFYNIDSIHTMQLIFPNVSTWQSQLAGFYNTSNNVAAKMVYKGDTLAFDVGVQYRGQTSYMMNTSDKKSFNIDLDYVSPTQDINNFEKLNLNCGFQDASFMREVIMENAIQKYIPGLAVNWVHLYINSIDWGLYANVQQFNGDYLKDWFLTNNGSRWRAEKTIPPGPPGPGGGSPFGAGQCSLNFLGNDSTNYTPYYQLKKRGKPNPWEDLIQCTNALNNTPLAALEDTLVSYLDVDRALWFIACEIIFADDDSYINKGGMDYYVYYEPETDRIVPMEYDANSCMDIAHVNWSPFYKETDANFELQSRLLAVPALRQRYLAHVRTILSETFNTLHMDSVIDHYDVLINSLVNADPKKIYTYADYLTNITDLKNFVTTRANIYNTHPEINVAGLSISNTQWAQAGVAFDSINPGETVDVSTQISGGTAEQVTLYYGTGLVGKFNKITMYDDGLHNDGAAADGRYGANLPAYTAATHVRFYVEVTKNNTQKTKTFDPEGAEHDVFYYRVTGIATGVDEFSFNANFTVYPNPTEGNLTILTEDYTNPIMVKDMLGRTAFEVIATSETIDMKGFASGVYIITQGNKQAKVILQ